MPRKHASKKQREWSEGTVGRKRKEKAKPDRFAQQVKKLKLTDPSQYATSKDLVLWVRTNVNYRYIPEGLLKELGLRPDLTLGGRDILWDFEDPPLEEQRRVGLTKAL